MVETSYTAGKSAKWCGTLENSRAVPQKIKYGVAILPSSFTLHINVHCRIIHKSPNIETTQMFINWQIDETNYICNGMLLGMKRNETLICALAWMTLGKLHEVKEHSHKGRNPFVKTFYRKCLKIGNSIDVEKVD